MSTGATLSREGMSMVPPLGIEPRSDDYKSTALTFVLRGNGRRDWGQVASPYPAMVPPGGLEPSTPALGERCSIL